MNFYTQLETAWSAQQSLLCVGIDPQREQVYAKFAESKTPYLDYCIWLIEQTHDYVCAYKFQIAYFSAQGEEAALEAAIKYIKQQYPLLVVILDAKRGDIAETAEQYAIEVFDRYQADAVTLNPYLGKDSAEPFLKLIDKGSIFLCKTSNAGSSDFQDLCIATEPPRPLHNYVAHEIANVWNNQNCLLVMGATWPNAIGNVRKVNAGIPFLIPGVGQQGGDLAQVIEAGIRSDGRGLIVCASRSIAQAEDPRKSAQNLAEEIQRIVTQHNGVAK